MSITENLQGCVERCTIDGTTTTFYFDSRFGTEINESALHPKYKDGSRFSAKPVAKVLSCIQTEDTFYLGIEEPNGQTSTCRADYCNIDKSFVIRSYDPRVIIPAILNNKDYLNYFIADQHPMFDSSYIVRYECHPLDCYSSNRNPYESDINYKYTGSSDDRFITSNGSISCTPNVSSNPHMTIGNYPTNYDAYVARLEQESNADTSFNKSNKRKDLNNLVDEPEKQHKGKYDDHDQALQEFPFSIDNDDEEIDLREVSQEEFDEYYQWDTSNEGDDGGDCNYEAIGGAYGDYDCGNNYEGCYDYDGWTDGEGGNDSDGGNMDKDDSDGGNMDKDEGDDDNSFDDLIMSRPRSLYNMRRAAIASSTFTPPPGGDSGNNDRHFSNYTSNAPDSSTSYHQKLLDFRNAQRLRLLSQNKQDPVSSIIESIEPIVITINCDPVPPRPDNLHNDTPIIDFSKIIRPKIVIIAWKYLKGDTGIFSECRSNDLNRPEYNNLRNLLSGKLTRYLREI